MKVGLIDVDFDAKVGGVSRRFGNTAASVFPNLALMKLSAYHKAKGDDVDWYMPFSDRYDVVDKSKVFSFAKEDGQVINADKVLYGGTGYCIKLVNGKETYQEPTDENYIKQLPFEVEHIMPDYTLYPDFKNTAIGFMSRGCPRGCSFCHVEAKEGRRSYKVADLSEWWDGQKYIILCDPNLLACKDWKDIIQQLADSKAWIDINQGLDARLLTEEKAKMLAKLKLKEVHFAWDRYEEKENVLHGLRLFAEHYPKKLDKWHEASVYVLVNFDTTPEQDLERVYTLRDMGYNPYIMVYDKEHADPFYKSLSRWVNMKPIFKTIERFEDYDIKKAKE